MIGTTIERYRILEKLGAGGMGVVYKPKNPIKTTIVLAEFANTAGDPVFEEAFRTALTVSLNQSPFLNVLGENEVAATRTSLSSKSVIA